MRPITGIVVHCSASSFGDAETIRRWHTDPPPTGRGWKDIGYHYVILGGRRTAKRGYARADDGFISLGRDLDGDGNVGEEIGAHALGLNATTIGICLIGNDPADFTGRQVATAEALVAGLCLRFGLTERNVLGHNEVPSGAHKACPVIDMHLFRGRVAALLAAWRAAGGTP
jgi:N-acetylmuramoyl-L-alanine amidase